MGGVRFDIGLFSTEDEEEGSDDVSVNIEKKDQLEGSDEALHLSSTDDDLSSEDEVEETWYDEDDSQGHEQVISPQIFNDDFRKLGDFLGIDTNLDEGAIEKLTGEKISLIGNKGRRNKGVKPLRFRGSKSDSDVF